MSEEKRRSSHTFRCTGAQWAVIEAAVERSGKSVSDFVVDTLLHAISGGGVRNQKNVSGHPMVLSPEMQEKMLRGVLLLTALRQAELRNAGKQDTLEKLRDLVNRTIEDKETGSDVL